MRLLVIADIDELYWYRGKGSAEVLLACGDVADQVIAEAAQAYGCKQVFAVKGNHDADRPFLKPVLDLHLRVREYGGLRFGGLNGAWKFKPRGAYLYGQDEVNEMLAGFPAVDVMVSHNSPRGIHDRGDGVHTGFQGLADYLTREKPKLLVHGHQHLERESCLGATRVVAVYGHRLIEI